MKGELYFTERFVSADNDNPQYTGVSPYYLY